MWIYSDIHPVAILLMQIFFAVCPKKIVYLRWDVFISLFRPLHIVIPYKPILCACMNYQIYDSYSGSLV